jgi:uncharacterized Zn finger protein
MIIADYKCEKCENTFQVTKKSIMDDFPENGTLKCEKCGKLDTYRLYTTTVTVSPGKYGNAATGYEEQMNGYQYNTITGRVKGGKTIKRLKG